MSKGSLFVISAPSGAGKTSVLAKVMTMFSYLELSVSYTTRAKRSKEKEGSSYHFISEERFENMIKDDEFLEWALVFGNSYGTRRAWVEEKLSQNIDVVLELDWQGALQIKENFSDAVLIFIIPPSKQHLEQRLLHRSQDSSVVIESRLGGATLEISKYINFDYMVLNDNFEKAVTDVAAIIRANRCLRVRQTEFLSGNLEDLL